MFPRLRVLLFRCGLGLAALIALSWFVSRWRGFYWCGSDGANTYRVELASGRLRLAHDYYAAAPFTSFPRSTPWTSGWVFCPTSRQATRLWVWNFHSQRSPGFDQIYIPLWAVFVIPALPITILEIRRRRALERDHNPNPCPHCDYNLTGLAPNSPCPECGRGKAQISKQQSSN